MSSHDEIPIEYLKSSYRMGLIFHHDWVMALLGVKVNPRDGQWITRVDGQERLFPVYLPRIPSPRWTRAIIEALCQAQQSGHPGPFIPRETGRDMDGRIAWWVCQDGMVRTALVRDGKELVRTLSDRRWTTVHERDAEWGLQGYGLPAEHPIYLDEIEVLKAFLLKVGLPLPTSWGDLNVQRREEGVTEAP